MPIYEYACPNCGVIEVFQGITEKPLKRCPRCQKRKVKKLISESSFHLKGSGWYATDYARNSAGGGNGGNGGNGKKKPAEKSASAAKSETSPVKDSSAQESSSKKPAASTSS